MTKIAMPVRAPNGAIKSVDVPVSTNSEQESKEAVKQEPVVVSETQVANAAIETVIKDQPKDQVQDNSNNDLDDDSDNEYDGPPRDFTPDNYVPVVDRTDEELEEIVFVSVEKNPSAWIIEPGPKNIHFFRHSITTKKLYLTVEDFNILLKA